MSKVFTRDAVEQFGKNYEKRVSPESGGSSRGGCMKAVYIGIGSLFGPRYDFKGDFHKEFFRRTRQQEVAQGLPEGRLNTIDQVFRALETEGVAATEQKFKPSVTAWELPDASTVASLEGELVRQVRTLADGSHFFGIALAGAYHSLILQLDKAGNEVRVFWMDQFSRGRSAVREGGFVSSPDVTGRLDQEVRQFGNDEWTSVWFLDPAAAIGASIAVDSDGDGNLDSEVPAAHEVTDSY